VTYAFVGQAESFNELVESMATAGILAIVFIYLVLASLYESFVTPFTIMLVLPLAACGAFIALFVTRQSLEINSMIGCILLLGVATKNSILLVDTANQLIDSGMKRTEALIKSGKMRLRPILMTTFALIAGMLPVAIGLNEASKQRTSMGIAIIGGLISSTLLSLVVVPAAFVYIDRFRLWAKGKLEFLKPKDEAAH
jgi:HAE1 family hydrophobic/amphiphilic exporter-1